MNYGQKGFSPNRSRGARGVPALVQLASELRQFSGEVALYLYYMKLKAGLRDEAVDKVIDCLDSDSLLTWESIIAARLRLLTLAKDAVGFAASWPFSYMSTIEELGDLSEGIRHHKLAVRRDMIFSLYLIVPWSLLAVFKQMGWHENTAWYTASLVHDFFSRILAARMLVSWVAVGIRLFQFADFRITADKRLLSYYARKLLKRLIYFAGSLTANLFYYVSVLTSQQQVSELVSKYLEPFGIRPYQRDIVVNLLGVRSLSHAGCWPSHARLPCCHGDRLPALRCQSNRPGCCPLRIPLARSRWLLRPAGRPGTVPLLRQHETCTT
jgi:hypothetical protein